MRFYVRELPQKQYHRQFYDEPIVPANCKIESGDIWCSIWDDYYIDKIIYSKYDLSVYATKTKNEKARKNCFYRKRLNHKR